MSISFKCYSNWWKLKFVAFDLNHGNPPQGKQFYQIRNFKRENLATVQSAESSVITPAQRWSRCVYHTSFESSNSNRESHHMNAAAYDAYALHRLLTCVACVNKNNEKTAASWWPTLVEVGSQLLINHDTAKTRVNSCICFYCFLHKKNWLSCAHKHFLMIFNVAKMRPNIWIWFYLDLCRWSEKNTFCDQKKTQKVFKENDKFLCGLVFAIDCRFNCLYTSIWSGHDRFLSLQWFWPLCYTRRPYCVKWPTVCQNYTVKWVK